RKSVRKRSVQTDFQRRSAPPWGLCRASLRMSTLRIEQAPFGSPLYDAVTALRYELLRRPLGLEFSPGELAREAHDTHLAALDGERIVGTLLLRTVDSHTARIMRMAVAPEHQGRAI